MMINNSAEGGGGGEGCASNATFFIGVNTRLFSYRVVTGEHAEERGRGMKKKGTGRVSRQGNASAVNEQTLIFSPGLKPTPSLYHHLSSTDHEQAPMFRNSKGE